MIEEAILQTKGHAAGLPAKNSWQVTESKLVYVQSAVKGLKG